MALTCRLTAACCGALDHTDKILNIAPTGYRCTDVPQKLRGLPPGILQANSANSFSERKGRFELPIYPFTPSGTIPNKTDNDRIRLNDRSNLLFDVGAPDTINFFPQATVIEVDLQIRRPPHQSESSDLREVFDVKTDVDATLACMMGQLAPIRFQKLRERVETATLQKIAQLCVSACMKVYAIALFDRFD
jgi:hypothetical protein